MHGKQCGLTNLCTCKIASHPMNSGNSYSPAVLVIYLCCLPGSDIHKLSWVWFLSCEQSVCAVWRELEPWYHTIDCMVLLVDIHYCVVYNSVMCIVTCCTCFGCLYVTHLHQPFSLRFCRNVTNTWLTVRPWELDPNLTHHYLKTDSHAFRAISLQPR